MVIPEGVSYHLGKIPTSLAMTWLVWLFIGAGSLAVQAGFSRIPSKLQGLFELGFGKVAGLAGEMIGPDAPRYYPLFISIFFFILTANVIGLVPGFSSPTADLNVTCSLAIIVFVYYNWLGFSRKGWHYLAHFFGPPLPWYMAPVRLLMFMIELIGNFSRPLSLALRLFCNIISKEILLGMLALLAVTFFSGSTLFEKALVVVPLFLRPFIILLGVMIAFVQALVFLILSISYVAGAVELEAAEESHHAKPESTKGGTR